jgi:hypothetical protein
MDVREIRYCIAVQVAILVALSARSASADLEPTRPHTWSKSVLLVDAACLLQTVSVSAPEIDGYRWFQFDVVDVLKDAPLVKRGDRLKLRRFAEGNKGSLYFVLGMKQSNRPGVEWEEIVPATRAGFDYLRHAPEFGGSARKRLPYFAKFLGSSDPFIAPDVLAEFRQATSFDDVVAMVPLFSRDKLRQRIVDPKTPVPEMGQYAFFLALCADAHDAELLAARIQPKGDDDVRIGIEGAMVGYLLLTGNAGLDRLDAWTFKNKSASWEDVHGMAMTLELLWNNQLGQKIPKTRLLQSMRLLLDCPRQADRGVTILADWKDWDSQERIVGLYDRQGPERQVLNEAIVAYLLDSIRLNRSSTQRHKAAEKYLEQLRAKDPQMVGDIERARRRGPVAP